MSELEYLQPGFDPASLTVPHLRSLLLEYDVQYPSSAKKPQLVELFNENILPRAGRIIAAHKRVKRSSKGIEDVASSQEGSVHGDALNDAELMPPPRVPASTKKSPRKSQAAGADDVEERTPRKRSSSGRASRTPSGRRPREPKPEQLDDEEQAVPPSTAKRGRKSTATPQIKDEEPDSFFSSDNPFQSGSSPPAEIEEENRRRTFGGEMKARKKSPKGRRKTDFIQTVDGALERTKSPRKSATSPSRRKHHVEAGEEFTPEEQQELEMARAAGQAALASPQRRTRRRQSNGVAKTALSAILFAMLGGAGFLWRQEKVDMGYCGVGSDKPVMSIGGIDIPEWADVIVPKCEPCPAHSFCLPNMRVQCEQDYVLKPHPLALGGVVPLPPTCEPDGEKARKVMAVADRAVEELRERNAKFECGDLKDEGGEVVKEPAINEEALKSEVASKRRKGMTQEEFEGLWESALGEILSRDEVTSESDGSTGSRTLRSTSLARVPILCAARRSLRLSVERHLWKLIAVAGLLVLGVVARFRFKRSRETAANAKYLAGLALQRLADQAQLAQFYGDDATEPWISVSQLRDDVLRNEFSSKRRQQHWDAVRVLVEGNSNVRSRVVTMRSGEVGKVWEWIGAVAPPPVDDNSRSPNGGLRKSLGGSRYSLGPLAGSSPPEMSETQSPDSRVWSESRPIY